MIFLVVWCVFRYHCHSCFIMWGKKLLCSREHDNGLNGGGGGGVCGACLVYALGHCLNDGL